MDKDLQSRVGALERRNRLYLAVLSVLGAALLMAQTRGTDATVVQCSRLEVVGANGNVVAMVGSDADGSTGLFVYDEAGRVRTLTVYDSQQSAWYALDSTGSIRAGIAHYAHGGSGVAVHGEGTRGAAVLYYKDGGSITIFDTAGAVVSRLPEK